MSSPDYSLAADMPFAELERRLLLVNECFKTFGVEAARGLNRKLGLPEATAEIIPFPKKP